MEVRFWRGSDDLLPGDGRASIHGCAVRAIVAAIADAQGASGPVCGPAAERQPADRHVCLFGPGTAERSAAITCSPAVGATGRSRRRRSPAESSRAQPAALWLAADAARAGAQPLQRVSAQRTKPAL